MSFYGEISPTLLVGELSVIRAGNWNVSRHSLVGQRRVQHQRRCFRICMVVVLFTPVILTFLHLASLKSRFNRKKFFPQEIRFCNYGNCGIIFINSQYNLYASPHCYPSKGMLPVG
jgi:hypothetical protein